MEEGTAVEEGEKKMNKRMKLSVRLLETCARRLRPESSRSPCSPRKTARPSYRWLSSSNAAVYQFDDPTA